MCQPAFVATARLDWTREEVILAMDAFVRSGAYSGVPIPGKTSPLVQELSKLLQNLNAHAPELQGPSYRNVDSVYLKFTNFRAIQTDGQHGMSSYSQLDAAVWRDFVDDLPELHTEAAAIRARLDAGSIRRPAPRPASEDVAVEGQHTEQYVRTGTATPTRATRAEQQLVLRFRGYLEGLGLEVIRKRYWPEGEINPLYADLWIPERQALIEAKSSDSRSAIREAIGQLYDYRRFHDGPIVLAVLLPYKPSTDKLNLLASASIETIWPYGDRYRDSARGLLV
jgi:hypothetical protein